MVPPKRSPLLTELAGHSFPRQIPAVGDPLLLYDGACGFCARSVQFLLRHESRRKDLRFASLQGLTGQRLMNGQGGRAGADSVVWCEGDRVWVRSDAVIRAGRYLGGPWAALALIGALVPRAIRDVLYRWIANHRHRLGGPACVIPTPEQKPRFLDLEG
ncbi:MAG TPA: DCC1-like thiol-disulfide oxidoreductase family protein [Gemmatimonadales bacterium]|nr:DCC1-like thiol-disulfide oxidoreductase family protein [Gemmatimonadales bacterium]